MTHHRPHHRNEVTVIVGDHPPTTLRVDAYTYDLLEAAAANPSDRRVVTMMTAMHDYSRDGSGTVSASDIDGRHGQ